MKTQIKLFVEKTSSQCEEKVNDWLKEQKGKVVIKNITYSPTIAYYEVCIVYEISEEENQASKDLEILEILKSHMLVSNNTVTIWINGNDAINGEMNTQLINKIKEWLDNDK